MHKPGNHKKGVVLKKSAKAIWNAHKYRDITVCQPKVLYAVGLPVSASGKGKYWLLSSSVECVTIDRLEGAGRPNHTLVEPVPAEWDMNRASIARGLRVLWQSDIETTSCA